MPVAVAQLTLWRLAIPLRHRFRHAAAARAVAEPIVVAVELSDRTIGYGETHPRAYVSGESAETAIDTIRDLFLPRLLEFHADSFPSALEAIDALPLTAPDGRPVTAARAAIELALIDAAARSFHRPLDEIAGWLGAPGLGPPGSLPSIRFSGVVGAEDPAGVRRSIRRMRCFGLRDFKLKVGDDGDDERISAAVRTLGGSLRAGRTTLRLDANGAWTVDQARGRLSEWAGLPIVCVEQPLPRGEERGLPELATATPLPLMADESLVTPDDAEDLIVRRAVSWFNIRVSKNGGILPSVRLALLARRHGLFCQLGCMVGETSILSAAGLHVLNWMPGLRFAEGCYGSFLIREDVSDEPLRFRFGGRPRQPQGPGLGLAVDPRRLDALSPTPPLRLPL